ncbi:hypothetical protein [Fictibacillus barbaricus]|uniref:Uncharacterized protein n=1 Tax=Fictibacillus barbaricus TaxID=182136 RepID=A0ABS2ZF21_9BACL|nr:hypothetical protein [Fictibacillus barbaricus]MBN3545201.1 hypothetical protein [Fictibacillus barbaricus]GGB60850.1 hypothetical protein GCM10007199_28440 [Fictibacillus barbaricus]
MGNVDKRKRLDEKVFSYQITKNNTVFIEYHGKQVMVVKGKEAEKIIKRIDEAATDKDIQLILAKVTGNFKRGNEKDPCKRAKG